MDNAKFPMNDTLLQSAQKRQMQKRSGLMEWWYRLSAPADPPIDATLAQREIARRGKLTSIILFAIMLIVIILSFITAFGPNHALFAGLLVGLLISSIALFFNRHGNIIVAGTLVVAQVIAGQTFTILSSPSGLTANTLGLLDQFVISELVAISFLPAGSIFVVAAINSIIFWALLSFFHHDAQVGQMLQTGAFSVLFRPIILQGIVAIVTYLWVSSALRALARADRAEEIAQLEQREVRRQQEELEQKHQLDIGIQQILQTHVDVANGNFQARAPLTKENVLWQIAFSLNNLIARLQRFNQSEQEFRRIKAENEYLIQTMNNANKDIRMLQQTKAEIAQLVDYVRRTKAGRHLPPLALTGTSLDPLIIELTASEEKQPVKPGAEMPFSPPKRPGARQPL
jgi:hypothetical protein